MERIVALMRYTNSLTRLLIFTLVSSALVLAISIVSLVGNGVTEAGQDATPTADVESLPPGTIEHALGSTVLEETPTRIVVLEWTYAEDLLALGIQPAGVADVDGYRKWLNVEPELAADVTDVGTRQEPSLETIVALEPDLIIGVQFRHEPIYDDLSDIAPTLIFNPYPGEDGPNQYEEMRETFLAIAKAVGREQQGQEVLTELDTTLAAAQEELAGAGYAGREFVLAQAFTSQDQPQIRVFTDNAMAVQILEGIGLENAWNVEFEQYGFSTVGVEALANVQDANFFYVVQEDDNVFENQLSDNPVWRNLAFVREARAYPLGGDTWLFGGPLSAELLVEKVVSLLLGIE